MKRKPLIILNIGLGLIAILLFVHLLGVQLPTVGKASYWIDQQNPICIASFGEEKSKILDQDQCCFQVQKQLNCENKDMSMKVGSEQISTNKRCYTGKGTIDYFLNNKMYNYCKKEGYLGYKLF